MNYRIVSKNNGHGDVYYVQYLKESQWIDATKGFLNQSSAQMALDKMLTEENKNTRVHEVNSLPRGNVQNLFD